jgi:Helix-turn-helix of DDE superfamily endonuclease
LLSYDKLSRKPILFKSFTGLSVKQFDDIFKEIESKYPKHEIRRLTTNRKDDRRKRERAVGAGRRFKLVVKDRVIMVFVYYRLYITYSLTEFLFDLDQSNVCRDIEKIESLIRECLPIPQKLYGVAKRLKTKEEVETYFPGFMIYRLFCRTANTQTKELDKKKDILFRQEKETYYSQESIYI